MVSGRAGGGGKTIEMWSVVVSGGGGVIFLDFDSNKQRLPLVDSWSRGLE